MSLRHYLFLATGACLLISLSFGAVLIFWSANRSVETELTAATASTADTLQRYLKSRSDFSISRVDSIVAGFDGQRHVRVTLLNASGKPVTSSRLAMPQEPAPRWFARLIGAAPIVIRIPVAGAGGRAPWMLLIESDAQNGTSEVWAQVRNGLATMALYCVILLTTLLFLVSRALSYFDQLNSAFETVPSERLRVSLPEQGFREVAAVARGFNRMTARLRELEENTARLQQQLLAVQEEERADIAHDLHDEVGPHLFAIGLDASSIAKLAAQNNAQAIEERTRTILASVGHVQKQVKAMLRQLMPARAVEFGINPALADLMTFWHSRSPIADISLDCSLDEAAIPEKVKETIYQIVREGVANALRHGAPSKISVTVRQSGANVHVSVSDDGLGYPEFPIRKGIGLSILFDRVHALGGTVSLSRGSGSRGVALQLSLPVVNPSHYPEGLECAAS